MAELEDRLDTLRAVVAEHVEDVGELVAAVVICNGCGMTAQVEPPFDLPPDGWTLGGHGEGRDFCPACVPVVRVDGGAICEECGKAFRDHPDDPRCPWPTFVLLCDGTVGKT